MVRIGAYVDREPEISTAVYIAVQANVARGVIRAGSYHRT